MIMVSPMNCILNFIDEMRIEALIKAGKCIYFNLEQFSILPTSQVNYKYKHR